MTFFCLFVAIKPENSYFDTCLEREVNPLAVYPLGPRNSSSVLRKVHHHPETLYLPTGIKTLQVDKLARISGPAQALSYMSHHQPPNSILRSPTSDPLKHEHSRQSRAWSTDTKGSQGERNRVYRLYSEGWQTGGRLSKGHSLTLTEKRTQSR